MLLRRRVTRVPTTKGGDHPGLELALALHVCERELPTPRFVERHACEQDSREQIDCLEHKFASIFLAALTGFDPYPKQLSLRLVPPDAAMCEDADDIGAAVILATSRSSCSTSRTSSTSRIVGG